MRKLNNDQKWVVWNGGLWSAYDSLTAFFLVAFALSLDANNTIIGLIGAIPFIARVISELPGAKLSEFYNRISFTVFFATISRFLWLGIILAPYIFVDHPLMAIIISYLAIRLVEMIPDPAWTTVLADVVPIKIRGEFFGFRNRIIGIATIFATVLGGWYLTLWPKESTTGFTTLMGVGVLFGLSSVAACTRVKEPRSKDHHHHSLKEFFAFKGHFKTFAISSAIFNFAVMFASPFFDVYMLKNLGLSYFFWTTAGALAIVTKIISYKYMGRLADKYGDKSVLLLSVGGVALVPLMYMFITPSIIWLIIPVQILSGLMWAGADITTFTSFLNYTDPKKRAVQTAEFNIIVSISMMIGPIVGGLIADKGAFILTGIPLVFAIATIMRALAVGLFAQLPEARVKNKKSLAAILLQEFILTIHRGYSNKIHTVVKRVDLKEE